MINDLFSDKKIRVMSDKILEEFKENFNGDENYHKAMYDKYFPIYKNEKVDMDRVFSTMDIEQVQEVTYFLFHRVKADVDKYIKPDIDYDDLKALLDIDLSRTPELQELTMTQGLSFCDAFTKEHRLSCPIVGKGNAVALNLLRDSYGLYKTTLKACYFHRTGVDNRSILRTSELVVQVVSNFKPVVAAKIWYEYAVKEALETGKDYVALYVPSEGWLGRLLSGYKIAHDFPQLQVYYVSVDPNPLVNREFHNMVAVLNKYHKLDNWHPETHLTGSEHFNKPPAGTDLKYDVSFTSPPYFNTEVYHNGYIIKFDNDEEIVLADNECLTVDGENEYEAKQTLLSKDLEIGMIHDTKIIKSIKTTGQSHSTSSTAEQWRVNFLLETYKRHLEIMKQGGYVITNIANVRSCLSLEEYTVRSMKEAGFDYIGESWYKLSRKPSKNTESEITSRKGEPIFIALIPN